MDHVTPASVHPLEGATLPLAAPAMYAAVSAPEASIATRYHRHVLYNFLYRLPKPLRHGPRPAWLHVGYWFRVALHTMLTLPTSPGHVVTS